MAVREALTRTRHLPLRTRRTLRGALGLGLLLIIGHQVATVLGKIELHNIQHQSLARDWRCQKKLVVCRVALTAGCATEAACRTGVPVARMP
jgi:hypothetical protein